MRPDEDDVITLLKDSFTSFDQRLAPLEQAFATRGNAGVSPVGSHGGGDTDSVAGAVAADANLAEYQKGNAKQYCVTVQKSFLARSVKNTILGNVTGADSGPLVTPDRQPGIIPGATQQLGLLDVIPRFPTGSSMVEYARELSFTNAAAETSEGEQKPEAQLTFELAEAPVRAIAHFLKTSNQVLADSQALVQYLNGRLRYGVRARLERQVVRVTARSRICPG
jgi:HK97 family phage major capsid protein